MSGWLMHQTELLSLVWICTAI